MHEPLEASHQTSAFKGAVLTVGMRWADRLLGLLSILILARLLVPDDFGLVAMAMVVAGLLDVLLDFGVSAALIQNERADDEDFHTAWTVRLAQSAVGALMLTAIAPAAASYYGDPRVAPVLQVIALTVLVGGFENIGTVSFQRNMEFGRDFRFFVVKKIFAVAFTISAAVALRSYWALVLGGLASRVTGVGLSYALSTFRPRFSLSRFSGLWGFSQWSLLNGVGDFVHRSLGRFVLGGRAGAAAVGAYTVGAEVAYLPTSELLAPLGRVMFPVFASAKHDIGELLRVVTLALSVQALIAIPASVGVALVAGDAIPLLLGGHWRDTVPVVQVLAFSGVATTLAHSGIYLLMATGKIRTLSLYTWGKALLLAGLLAVSLPGITIDAVARADLASACAGLVVVQVLAGRTLPGFGTRVILRESWRPVVAAAVMALVVAGISGLMAAAGAMPRLLVEITIGATTYMGCLLLLWRAVGAPPGAETYILGKFFSRRHAI